jgi:hypothetical protein
MILSSQAKKASKRGNSNNNIMADQNDDSNDAPKPIMFPCNTEEQEFPSSSSSSSPSITLNTTSTLEEACALAIETERTLVLREDVVVSQTIVLKKRQHLVIRSSSSSNNDTDNTKKKNQSRKQKLSGLVHSLFLLNNASRLTLQNIELHHNLESEDHRKIGAAVNLRYKGHLEMTDCMIRSQSGFCCWAVQKTRVTLTDCELRAPTRSAVVCFGQASCHMERCSVPDAGVHAICARGACRLELVDCDIERSAARAIYAYANASVVMEKCTISHTIHPGKAAIEISAAGCAPQDGKTSTSTPSTSTSTTLSSLTMHDCKIVNNAGAGICLRGSSVACTMTGTNVLENNGGGNVLEKDLLEDDDDNEEGKQQKNNGQVRRDAAGTSFRQGDWWCPKCRPRYVLLDRQSQCSQCASPKSSGRVLTVEEIHQCNQGMAFVDSTTTTTWCFDADDKGWVAYDTESSRLLEEAYQQRNHSKNTDDSAESTNPAVLIADGRYQVNVVTMEQINVDSHFMRLVRRQVVE